MNRRHFLAAMGACMALPSWAQQPIPGLATTTTTALVELVNFHCPRCRVVNDHFDRIDAAAKQAGVTFRVAPIAWEGQSLWPDRVYYAVRDLFPAVEPLVRDMLFDGIQREGQRFEELPQVMAFFERRQLVAQAGRAGHQVDLLAIADRASTDIVLLSEMKAGRLVDLSGATAVPVFVWVRDGEVLHTLSPSDAADPGPLVLKVIQQLSNRQSAKAAQ